MKKERKNVNKDIKVKKRISLKSNLKRIFMLALFLLLSSFFVFADGWTNEPSHQTLYADTITSRTDGSSVRIADAQGLYVTGSVGIGTAGPSYRLEVAPAGTPYGNLFRVADTLTGSL